MKVMYNRIKLILSANRFMSKLDFQYLKEINSGYVKCQCIFKLVKTNILTKNQYQVFQKAVFSWDMPCIVVLSVF